MMAHLAGGPRQDRFQDPRGRIPGFERQGEYLATRGFHFFAAGDEVRPIGAFNQDVRQDGGDQLARGVFVEERDGVHGGEGCGKFGALVLGDERAGGTFQSLDAGVGVEGQDQDVAERSGGFKQSDVTGMQNVVAAVGEDDLLPARFHAARSAISCSRE